MTNFKRILTILAVVWAFIFLFVAYQYSENGKYQIKAGEAALVLNTRTGMVYLIEGEGSWKPLGKPE